MIVVFGSINVDLLVRCRICRRRARPCSQRLHDRTGRQGRQPGIGGVPRGRPGRHGRAVGRDAFAETALTLLRRDGVDLSLVATTDRPTGCARSQSTPPAKI